MSKRSDTRKLLINTALEMLHEEGPSAGVGHILLSKVVERANRTVGSAYPHWPGGQKDFQKDLAIEAVKWRDKQSTEKTYGQIKAIFEAGGPLEEVLRLGSEGNIQSVTDDVAFLTTMALRMSAFGSPELVKASRERHLEAMAAFTELYTAVLVKYGRRMRSPFTVDHLGLVFAALMEGFALQTVTGEEHPRITLESDSPEVQNKDETQSNWTLLGIAVVALVQRMTEPDQKV